MVTLGTQPLRFWFITAVTWSMTHNTFTVLLTDRNLTKVLLFSQPHHMRDSGYKPIALSCCKPTIQPVYLFMLCMQTNNKDPPSL